MFWVEILTGSDQCENRRRMYVKTLRQKYPRRCRRKADWLAIRLDGLSGARRRNDGKLFPSTTIPMVNGRNKSRRSRRAKANWNELNAREKGSKIKALERLVEPSL